MAETPPAPGQENQQTLSNLLQESRRFPPPPELAAEANVRAEAFAAADADRLGFWAEQAGRLRWERPWDTVLDWQPPFAKWFVGGKLNAAVNCVDRHVEAGRGDKVAYHWEGEPGDTRTITYAQLKDLVCQAANALEELGVTKGDRVAIYMPMIPETVVAMLACARIGAPHMVVFGGFSADALGSRLDDSDAKLVITADGGYRRGKPSGLKPAVDEALRSRPGVRNVLVVRRTGQDVEWTEGRDVWWHDVVERQGTEHAAPAHDAEDPLYIMYTSGTTAKPKGILHTTGGYLTQVSYTHWAVFDLKPETDVFWTAADIGWVTGHSYIVYGPLSNGATSVMYEGTPDTPHRGRFWEIVQKYGVTIAYMAPTAIRTFMKWGEDIPAQYDLSSLRVLGSVGEPINPEAYVWYRKNIGGDRVPVVDTWWQTETGAIMVSPLPGVTEAKPGAAMRPLPGISVDVVDDEAKSVPDGGGGFIVVREPWPSMLRGIWGDPKRYEETYWSRFEGLYFPGDGAKRDEDGDIWLLGRVDDVMLVSGHNISTTEVESALVAHAKVAEAAVVGATDPVTGQAIVAFVILRGEAGEGGEELVRELRDHVGSSLGPIAKPRQILVVPELPKTRSGKIMRRLLRDVAENRTLGDVSTLTDAKSIETLRDVFQGASGSDD
ncbi:acetate--CoA ligase [Marinitenerispora sediminis]|uniref:Acetyl-coenzyme A synthetase n=1 Tax=Marinitenerispora sediminis TaxID=1931232 RepID=A0A368TB61_9ACTN|nr:acetate--CoA ligase [Marinitenerispora sediminis]RCV53648.1 acetate--CoA ligase [Marinitenerispora sediminis]RCV57368.1 acetate--CoA ligase [Marinitenerispora sediminis]RCV62352.1 acetate--CoA ligase [Marinitenerispora sediminis]